MARLTGQAILAMADAFIERNPMAWLHMKLRAKQLIRQGRRFSIDQLVIEVRYGMELSGYDDGFRINNSSRAGLARRLREAIPEAADYMETRKSVVDDVPTV